MSIAVDLVLRFRYDPPPVHDLARLEHGADEDCRNDQDQDDDTC